LEDRTLLSITEFPIPTPSFSEFVTTGPDGNVWFTEGHAANKIGRITPAGTITEFSIPTANSGLVGITAGPDGNLWFVERFPNQIGRITPTGAVTEFPIPSPNSDAFMIVAGPDGNLWFTEATAGKIGRITPTGVVTEFSLGMPGDHPETITAGPDGNLWFTEVTGNKIGRITPTGTITEFLLPTADSQPEWITTGPDGNLWFVENTLNQVGRITTSGVLSEFPVGPAASNQLAQIITGPDGNLWVTGYFLNQVLQISPAGVVTARFDIPTSNAQAIGITVGADGNLWFAESNANQIGRLNLPMVAPIPDQTVIEGSALAFTVSATDSDPSAVLTYSLDSAPAGASIDPNSGIFTFTPTEAPGTYPVTVRVTDNGTPALSDTTSFNIIVTKDGTTTALTSSANPSSGGQAVTLTADVSADDPGAGTPTGTVTFATAKTVLAIRTLDATGHATFTTSSLPGGSTTIFADYNGDSDFLTSTGSVVQQVNKVSTAASLTVSPPTTTFGQPVTFTVTVTAASGTAVGPVTFKEGNMVLGRVPLDGSGHAILTISNLPVGKHKVTAYYGGNPIFNASASSPVVEIVNAGASVVSFVAPVIGTQEGASNLPPSLWGVGVNASAENDVAMKSTLSSDTRSANQNTRAAIQAGRDRFFATLSDTRRSDMISELIASRFAHDLAIIWTENPWSPQARRMAESESIF
jgi:streptogramin lyase